ncbi:E3 ubiquitin/ISG15 ligase TRIM25-like [Rhinichthys klamathensis goyatoka]|uniref:E3 ubiquitin/ISG15 ligase TRIM25-like n=1 Tax=Rhinichthys klamathensis goyatoka TaxID=3034132 RepID=UPI0024B5FFE5|nr:E3 ubiquitin/ISG15 ligase TRIM25-like [Rhinichthys klamathensis goyatoka]
MAESPFHTQNHLKCPICLTLLKNPVTTSCGHSFCMDCIKRCWDVDFYRGVYSCPTCRTTFNQRPALSRSTVLADILEGMKQKAPARPVTCDVCKGIKVKAIQSCLVCMASYCQAHVRPHYESKAFKKHKLVKASPNLQHQICPHHHKALEVYCYNDQKCICVVCMGNQHSGHKTVSAAAEMAKKQEELKIKKRDFIQKTTDWKKEVHQCKKAVISFKRSAQAAVENSDRIFTEIIRSIQNIQAEVREKIRAQENKEVRDAESHIQRLEEDIVKLQKENSKVEPLLCTENHVYFFKLQKYYCFYSGVVPYNSSRDVNTLTFQRVTQSLSELKSQLDEVCEEHMREILYEVADVQIFQDDDLSEEEEEVVDAGLW